MANIYIVEDDTNIQEIEAIALKNSGHSVEQFDDAAHFYKKLEEKLPDLAILDLDIADEEYYGIAFRKGSDATAAVNGILSELADAGTLVEIAEKYGLEDAIVIG